MATTKKTTKPAEAQEVQAAMESAQNTAKVMKVLTFHDRVLLLQNELKAPKSKYNSFSNFYYRSCEDIYEAVKPLLAKHGMILNLSDTIEMIGTRFYIKAVATLEDTESSQELVSVGWAREDESKKGMDGSQITGTASSYARKYALNGLLLIDDTKDADTDEYQKTQATPKIDLDMYLREIDELSSCDAVNAWWKKNRDMLGDDIKEKVYNACVARGKQLNNQ